MEKGRKKTGLVVGLIIFGVLAFGSLVSVGIGAMLDDSKDIETGKVAFEEKKAEPPKQSEAPKEEIKSYIKEEDSQKINPDAIKSELKKYIADKEQEIEDFYASNPTPEMIAKFNRKLIEDNDAINSKFEKVHGLSGENKVNLVKELPAVGYLYALSLCYMNKVQGKEYDSKEIKWYKDGIKEAVED